MRETELFEHDRKFLTCYEESLSGFVAKELKSNLERAHQKSSYCRETCVKCNKSMMLLVSEWISVFTIYSKCFRILKTLLLDQA